MPLTEAKCRKKRVKEFGLDKYKGYYRHKSTKLILTEEYYAGAVCFQELYNVVGSCSI
jgi:hypothetical protein